MTDSHRLSGSAVRAAIQTRSPLKPFQSSAVSLPALTEREFQRQVMDLAGIFGWRIYHPALSKWSERGWPDLALVRPPRFVLAELKRENGKTTPYQDTWLELLRACPGVETYLWRPSDIDTIADVLR